MLLYRCEYMKIILIIDSKIPHFLDKYPGYKIYLFKLHYFNMIIQEKPKNEINDFLNKELLPLLKIYNEVIEMNYSKFEYYKENSQILKCRSYQQIWEKSCKIFEECLKLSLDWILWVETEKNKNNQKVINYNKEKENITKNIHLILNFEKEIEKNNENNIFNKNHNFLDENNLYLFNNKISNENDFDIEEEEVEKPFNDSIFFHKDLCQNKEFEFPFNKLLNENIEENYSIKNNDLINNLSYDNKNNNLIINDINNDNSNNNLHIKNNGLFLITSVKIENKSLPNNSINGKESIKSYKLDSRKKKIKEFKFKLFKRENLDKKILRKFKKFLKAELKGENDKEIKNFINNNGFWLDYISMNLMPPFFYKKENILFKSFNTQYLCWFFEHKFSLELYNIYIKINYEKLLPIIKKAYNLDENSDDFILVQTYLNTMPLIYGHQNINRITSDSSKAKSLDDEINDNEIDNKIENREDDIKNDEMIIEKDFIYVNENNNTNLNNIEENNIMNFNNMNNVNLTINDPSLFLFKQYSKSNINENDFNEMNISDDFEENNNDKSINLSLFK